MAQEFLIKLWCDRHSLQNERVEASQSVNLSLPGYPDRTVDLCEDCHVFLFADLIEVVGKNGRPAEAGTSRPAASKPQAVQPQLSNGVPCPVCPHWPGSDKLLNSHWKNVHYERFGIRMSELFGSTCPVCGQEDLSNLGVHASKLHGATGTASLFQEAAVGADDHGVLRAFKERVEQAKMRVRKA